MKLVADLHTHSRFSRATSKELSIANLDHWARVKGISVMGTGDFTHPLWLSELKETLELAEPGLFCQKGQGKQGTRFLLTAEISCIYSKNGAVRKIHLLMFAPSFEAAEKINVRLSWIGNLRSDGRPILGIDAKEVVKIALDAGPECHVVPAHAWTPWFSLFGSKSGFDTMEECFEELTPHLQAIETGLSSDPAMNWRLSQLDKVAIISNSDSHSLEKIGREANVVEAELDYHSLFDSMFSRDPSRFLHTIEFFPEEGKYHYDGHRQCGIVWGPQETKKHGGVCPVCGRPVTVGVLNRVEELADRPEGFVPERHIPFKSLIPLVEIIADVSGQGVGTKQGTAMYHRLVETIGNEFAVLLDASQETIASIANPEIAEGVINMREKKVSIDPGYDGEYGNIHVRADTAQSSLAKQSTLL